MQMLQFRYGVDQSKLIEVILISSTSPPSTSDIIKKLTELCLCCVQVAASCKTQLLRCGWGEWGEATQEEEPVRAAFHPGPSLSDLPSAEWNTKVRLLYSVQLIPSALFKMVAFQWTVKAFKG